LPLCDAYTGSILKGTKPASFAWFAINQIRIDLDLQTARSLGIDVPPTLLARDDEV